MIRIFIFLMIIFTYPPVFAETPDDPKMEETLKANVTDFRDWMIKELSQFPKADSNNMRRGIRKYASILKKSRIITANQYNQAAKSDWVKSQVIQGLSALSLQLANTAGTAFAQNGATQLQQNSVQLQQSNDPQFQQIGSLFTQQAQALQAGNVQAADQIANQVSAVPAPDVASGYQPTQNETSFASTLHQIIGSIIGSVLDVAVAVYGGPVGSAVAAPAIQSIFGGGQNTASVLATGQSLGVTLPSAANVSQGGGGAVMQQLGNVNVKPLQPQNSSNAGTAPPAQ
jgi:hypothetical protein